MNYALILCTNGHFSVAAEYGDNLQSARVGFHQRCAALWNAEDVKTCKVMIVDEQLNCVAGLSEYITHPDPEPEPEPVEE